MYLVYNIVAHLSSFIYGPHVRNKKEAMHMYYRHDPKGRVEYSQHLYQPINKKEYTLYTTTM